MRTHQEIAEEILGYTIEPGGYAPCPGAACHTKGNGRRDWRIIFDPTGQELPHEHCFHASCQGVRDEFMSRLYKAIRAEEKGEKGSAPRWHTRTAPPPPRPPKPPQSLTLAHRIAKRCSRSVSEAALLAASPLRIPKEAHAWPELLLDTLYPPNTRIMLFYTFKSQGQFIRVTGRGNYALGERPGQKARLWEYPLPEEGHEGAWFQTAPVTGMWQENPNNIDKRTGHPRMGRRHQACCLAYPYAVIESDELPADVWLPILAQLEDPIAAIYTSGGKSIHALIRVDAKTPQEFNAACADIKRRLVPLGADPKAITPVRLTRLPGIWRLEKMQTDAHHGLQRLLYLNPAATITAAARPTQPIIHSINALS